MPSSVRCSSASDRTPARKCAPAIPRLPEKCAPARRANIAMRISGSSGSSQRPVVRYSSMSGNEVHQDDDFQGEKNTELDERFPGAGNEIDDAARGFQNEKGEPEMAEDTERAAAAAAIDFELWLDFGFEDFEVRVDAAGGHAAEFAIDQRQIGKDRQAQGEQHRADCVRPEVDLHERPNFRRRRCSMRVIWPRSVSWS